MSGQPVGNTEDEHSVGSHVTFGKFRALYLADFPWNKEFEMMCPNNRLGTVEFLLVSRHGQHSSNSEALVHALRPRVAVINNGIRKGGQPETMRVLYSSPGLEDIWQGHVAQLSGPEHAIPGIFVTNIVDDPQHSPAYWIKVSAQSDGSFTVTNSRNAFRKTYVLRRFRGEDFLEALHDLAVAEALVQKVRAVALDELVFRRRRLRSRPSARPPARRRSARRAASVRALRAPSVRPPAAGRE